jgi:hypothetical protein
MGELLAAKDLEGAVPLLTAADLEGATPIKRDTQAEAEAMRGPAKVARDAAKTAADYETGPIKTSRIPVIGGVSRYQAPVGPAARLEELQGYNEEAARLTAGLRGIMGGAGLGALGAAGAFGAAPVRATQAIAPNALSAFARSGARVPLSQVLANASKHAGQTAIAGGIAGHAAGHGITGVLAGAALPFAARAAVAAGPPVGRALAATAPVLAPAGAAALPSMVNAGADAFSGRPVPPELLALRSIMNPDFTRLQPTATPATAGVGSTIPMAGGQLEPGNIDLTNRPRVRNSDGSVSTIRSLGVNIDGKETLIPTVSEDGRIMSDDEAVAQYKRTGKHLGKFNSVAASNAGAVALHDEQERMGNKWGRSEDAVKADRDRRIVEQIAEEIEPVPE